LAALLDRLAVSSSALGEGLKIAALRLAPESVLIVRGSGVAIEAVFDDPAAETFVHGIEDDGLTGFLRHPNLHITVKFVRFG
jgi:hypothetical protein